MNQLLNKLKETNLGFSLNQINLIGTIGRDRETRSTSGGTDITNVSIATEHSYKKGDDWERETTWHKLVFFNLSDFFLQQLNKGMQIHVRGRLSVNGYTDKEGVKRYNTQVICENNSLIVFPKDGNRNGGSQSQTTQSQETTNESDNDDLPF